MSSSTTRSILVDAMQSYQKNNGGKIPGEVVPGVLVAMALLYIGDVLKENHG